MSTNNRMILLWQDLCQGDCFWIFHGSIWLIASTGLHGGDKNCIPPSQQMEGRAPPMKSIAKSSQISSREHKGWLLFWERTATTLLNVIQQGETRDSLTDCEYSEWVAIFQTKAYCTTAVNSGEPPKITPPGAFQRAFRFPPRPPHCTRSYFFKQPGHPLVHIHSFVYYIDIAIHISTISVILIWN